jgi:hypothetical protein
MPSLIRKPALSRRTVLSRGAAVGVALATPACMFGYGGKIAPPPIAGLGDIALSPDGRIVAVQFREPKTGESRLVLYDWGSGRVTRVPYPIDTRLASPCFSPDGRFLAAVRGGRNGDVAFIDLKTYEIKSLALENKTSNYERYCLRFSPNGRQVVYAEDRIAATTGIVLRDIAGATSRELLDPALGFLNVSDLCFAAPDEIIFQARIPRAAGLVQHLRTLGYELTDQIQYSLKFGEIPVPGFAEPALLDPQFDTRRGRAGSF